MLVRILFHVWILDHSDMLVGCAARAVSAAEILSHRALAGVGVVAEHIATAELAHRTTPAHSAADAFRAFAKIGSRRIEFDHR